MALLGNRLKARIEAVTTERDALASRVEGMQRIQELLARKLSTLQDSESEFVGNEYKDYATAVQAISDKYKAAVDWGCLQTGTIIDLRAAFILGDGVQVVHTTEKRSEAEAELDWADAFFAYNGLDAEMAQEITKEAEIEGKAAVVLNYDDDAYEGEAKAPYPGMVSARFMSWLSRKYEVTADPNDYLWYRKISWKDTGTIRAGEIEEPGFVYKKFGGRLSDPNDAQPKIMKCLTQVDRLDKALRDLREINHLTASPVADYELEDATQAEKLLSQIENINWKIRKAIVHVGTFSYKSPDTSGIQNLIAEIELLVKMISGTTGIPIHYLGLLDLLHNRATGDNTRELVMAATSRERAIWRGLYEELVRKAMDMYNAETGKTPLDPSRISVDIPLISEQHWANIQNVLIPAAAGGIVSKEYVASQIPGVDTEREAELREESEQKEAERAKQDLEMVRATKGEEDEE